MTSLVVGAARSGIALAGYLVSRGETVRLADHRDLALIGRPMPDGVELVLGGYDLAVLDGVSVVYASPGVPWDSNLLAAARARGLEVSSEMDLFLRHCPGTVVGITGTKGKTTTTALTGAILGAGPRPVMVGGNIGATVIDRLETITADHLVVLELSSFQIESVADPHVHIGVVLNVTPDHLDRHGTLERYAEIKGRLIAALRPGDHAVLNHQDPIVAAMAERTAGEVTWFDRHLPVPPMPVPGRHNVMNALAAASVGRLAGLDDSIIEDAVRSFPGVEHRIELVGEWDGVRWYNDSAATNPQEGAVAVETFAGRPLVLIAGGRGAGFDLSGWLRAVHDSVDAIVLIGESADELERALAGHPKVLVAADLESAVEMAGGQARPGGVVLFSPAYKSFDMFSDYEDRGRRFKAAVRRRAGVLR